MRLNALVVAFALAAVAPVTQAETSPDPLFGNDPHAKAVLDCHADYASRFAKAVVKTQATPTEVATAAYAHCVAEFSEFVQSTAASATSSDNPGVFLAREEYQADEVAKMREYAFAHALDVYLTNTTTF